MSSRRSTDGCAVTPSASTSTKRRGSEEHTSELQSPCNLVCRLLLEKKKTVTQKRLILNQFLDTFSDTRNSPNIKTLSLKIIVLPMLLYEFAKRNESRQLRICVADATQY